MVRKDRVVNFPLETERSIINDVLIGRFQQANTELRRVLDCNLREIQMSGRMLFEFKAVMKLFFRRLLHALHAAEKDVFLRGDEVYTQFDACAAPELIYELILGLYDELADYAAKDEKEENNLLYDIMKYIETNYEKDLSLEKLADTFQVTSYYISRLFKKQLGVNYKDYLNRYRIIKAKEMMLQNPKMYIKDVSERVGFNSMKTFHRVFKNLEDITPGAYIRQIRLSKRN